MSDSFFNINDADKKIPPTKTNIKPMIRQILLADDGACWAAMERFCVGKHITGSKAFDQHSAVLVLLRYDADHGYHLATLMEDNEVITHKYLWSQLLTTLSTWLQLDRGVVIGLRVEHKNTDDLS